MQTLSTWIFVENVWIYSQNILKKYLLDVVNGSVWCPPHNRNSPPILQKDRYMRRIYQGLQKLKIIGKTLCLNKLNQNMNRLHIFMNQHLSVCSIQLYMVRYHKYVLYVLYCTAKTSLPYISYYKLCEIFITLY